jgi:hypothetical protein
MLLSVKQRYPYTNRAGYIRSLHVTRLRGVDVAERRRVGSRHLRTPPTPRGELEVPPPYWLAFPSKVTGRVRENFPLKLPGPPLGMPASWRRGDPRRLFSVAVCPRVTRRCCISAA